MKNHPIATFVLVAACLLHPAWGSSDGPRQEEPTAQPLAPFERLVGGQWQLGDSSLELEWGVGRRSVKSRSYFAIDGERRLVSEGTWFFHPGEQQIKGVFTAIDMPIDFFDYTTRFEGNTMVSDLVSYGPGGEKSVYVETWELTDASHYVWKLFQKTPDGLQEVMGGTYSRSE